MNRKSKFDLFLTVALLVSWLLPSAAQQEIGTEICSCAPNTYEFTLDFSLFCPPVNITIGDAVAATTCMVSPFGDPDVSDLIPVAVQSIDILELNQNLQIMSQENIAGNFGDGDTFQYTSYAALPGEIVNPEDLPRAIQINIIGVNQFEEPIINVYLITFTNSCGSYPVLFEGQSAGWTRFSDLGPPSREYCPLVPSPSPTVSPDVPTPSPSVPPTPSPTPPPITSPPVEMSMSMSMDLNLQSLFGDMNAMAREFGREYGEVIDGFGIRGSRGANRSNNQKLRNKAGIEARNGDEYQDPECDDYPCSDLPSASASKSSKQKGENGSSSSSKGHKSSKKAKRDKDQSKKDARKLTKSPKQADENRLLSSLYETFGREEDNEESMHQRR